MTPARVLIVENDAARIAALVSRLPTSVITITNAAPMAQSLVVERIFEYVFLDHDLRDYSPPAFGCGRDVATWMVERTKSRYARVVVHSVNTVSAPKIHAALTAGGYRAILAPFPSLMPPLDLEPWLAAMFPAEVLV